jgi:hypothetical protein
VESRFRSDGVSSQQIAALAGFLVYTGMAIADDGYSVPFGANKSVWLFGDTFVEMIGNGDAVRQAEDHDRFFR